MGLSTTLNKPRGGFSKPSLQTLPVDNDDTGLIGTITHGLRGPLTVSRVSGSARITFSASGSVVSASLSGSVANGSTLTAVVKISQSDGWGVIIPIIIDNVEPPPPIPEDAMINDQGGYVINSSGGYVTY